MRIGIQHVDLCVSEVGRSLEFYLGMLGPLGLREDVRVPSWRGTEEIVYLRFGEQNLGLRPADGGAHANYQVGIEHVAFEVSDRAGVEEAFARAQRLGARIHCPPEQDKRIQGYYSFFALDPDGIRVEVFCAPAGGEGETRWQLR